jgi:hypothetical protein
MAARGKRQCRFWGRGGQSNCDIGMHWRGSADGLHELRPDYYSAGPI